MNKITTTEKLVKFVNQRPGLDFANYGDMTSYRAESREITADKHDFFELLSLAQRRVDNFEEKLTNYLKKNSGRLCLLENGSLEYTAGQYFCVEYRPAANNVLKSLIWESYKNETNPKGYPIYADGNSIRKAIKYNLSSRVGKNYFN